jgi:hypothetical protein
MRASRLLLAGTIAIFAVVSGFADQLNLLPPISNPSSNPHTNHVFDGVKVNSKDFNNLWKDQDETFLAAMAYLHPSSPHKGDTGVLERLIVLLDGRFSLWEQGKDLDVHPATFEATYAYLALKTYAPDKIPADKKERWEKAIDAHTRNLITKNPQIYRDHLVGPLIVNMDIFKTMSVYFGALATGDAASAAIGKAAIEECMTKCQMADGATHYANYSNETYLYHHAIVWGAAWYYLFSGSPKIKLFLDSMVNYMPLTDHRGFGEYSTAPPWKPFYTQLGAEIPLAMAYLTGDPFNYQLGKESLSNPKESTSLLLSCLYHPGLQGKELPDNFLLYDRNILGPRARFGTWGSVGTTRDPSTGAPELHETFESKTVGISTFVGVYVLKEKATKLGELNAALHGACPGVKIAPGDETDFARGEKWAFLTGIGCHNAVSKSTSVYGLSTRYPVNKKLGGEGPKGFTGWDGLQEWVFTPDRIIGLSAITCDHQQIAYGLAQRLTLFSFRGVCNPGDGKAQSLVQEGADVWSYGDLRLKAHWNNYGGKPDFLYYGIMNGYGGSKPLEDKGTALLTLNDPSVQANKAQTYPSGTEKYVLIETTQKGREFATDVAVLKLPTSLRGFEFAEEGRRIRMIHNISANPVYYSGIMKAPFGQTRILASWDEGGLHPLQSMSGNVTIPRFSIPAYGHVLIINSSHPEDANPGYLTYEKVFLAK